MVKTNTENYVPIYFLPIIAEKCYDTKVKSYTMSFLLKERALQKTTKRHLLHHLFSLLTSAFSSLKEFFFNIVLLLQIVCY